MADEQKNGQEGEGVVKGSLAEAIARRRAELNARLAARRVGSAPAAGEGAEPQAEADKPAETLAEKPAEPSGSGAAGAPAPPGPRPGIQILKRPEDFAKGGSVARKLPPGGPPAGGQQQEEAPAAAAAAPAAAAPGGSLTQMQVLLMVNTFLLAVVGGVLVYMLTHRPVPRPTAAETAMKAVRSAPAGPQATTAPARTRDANTSSGSQQAGSAVPVAVAPSWASAETAYVRKDYDRALERYSRLLLASRRLPSESASGAFFEYRIGRCLWQLGRLKEAREVLGRLEGSDVAAVCASANADLAWMAERAGQHLLARAHACRALAALKALEGPFELEADCDYFAARALTEKVRSYHSSEQAVPWSRLRTTDLFADRTEAEIRRLLEGRIRPSGPLPPGPVVRIARRGEGWSVTARHAAVEDVVHQLASRAGRDVRWASVPPAVRRRALTLRLEGVPEQRAFELVCGSAGLLGRFSWEQVSIHDPESVESLAERKSLLGGEAISAWRRFALRHSRDGRVPEGQFALAVLYEYAGDVVSAMKQYQLVGRQYHNELELAPLALIRSAELRIPGLRDFAGARQDLRDVLNLYPGYRRVDQVYLLLGRFAMQAGQLDEALKALQTIEQRDMPAESRRQAYLELGDCHWRRGEYAEASKYLSRYLAKTKEHVGRDVVRAYLLLGRSEAAQGHRVAASAAFARALSARPLKDDYVEAVLLLTEAQTAAEDYVGAMATLGRIRNERLTDAQRFRYLVAMATLYRRMGLPSRARAVLRKEGSAVQSAGLRARLAAEQARCLAEEGDLRGAREILSEALGRLKGGGASRQVTLDLAEICLKLADYEQAVVLAREALRGLCPPAEKKRGTELLGRALLKLGRFEQAARALAELAPKPPAPAGGIALSGGTER